MSAARRLSFDPIRRAADQWRARWGEQSPYAAMASATSIMRAQQILLADLDAALAPFNLTFARYEALVLLTFSRADGLPMSKVGERLMVHPTSATNIVQRLAAQGLVERLPNPRDGRGALARITDEGRRVMEEATSALHAIEFGLAALDEREHRELFDLLHKLRVHRGDFVSETD
ncbi:MarR family winged helix-turn-helix transcriptional regulator [Luteipulveratus halotolerans]|uniref:MarR family transcriptional regulator n=1 Tax=Luteipulveratus halotolerans TaxID=1631356 RepID=A0A0L6CGD3_9MICO|nr:MarR family transcriptional regulator [Luteipulveratus halotolerans]KNX36635.1 MarR family transcriptional regulator [Luteipulveratus halotolerans]